MQGSSAALIFSWHAFLTLQVYVSAITLLLGCVIASLQNVSTVHSQTSIVGVEDK